MRVAYALTDEQYRHDDPHTKSHPPDVVRGLVAYRHRDGMGAIWIERVDRLRTCISQ